MSSNVDILQRMVEEGSEIGNHSYSHKELTKLSPQELMEQIINTEDAVIDSIGIEPRLMRPTYGSYDDNLNETLEAIFKNIEASAQGTDSEANFKGLFDDIDVNSNKLGGSVVRRNQRLVKLINSVAEMNLGSYQDNTIDAFGDAYEY